MEKLHFREGDVIVQQGQRGENFYVVGAGQVGVVIGRERVSKIRQGGTFGELPGVPPHGVCLCVRGLSNICLTIRTIDGKPHTIMRARVGKV